MNPRERPTKFLLAGLQMLVQLYLRLRCYLNGLTPSFPALNLTWPGVCPAKTPPGKNPVSRAWLQCALNSPMAFYGFIFAAALHHNHLHGGQIPDQKSGILQLSYQTQAIKLINAMLRSTDNNTPPSDDLLVSILILAAHGQKQNLDPPLTPAHPQSPLAKAQNLDFYGTLSFIPAHLAALYILVEQKGGLDKIEVYGLADTLALFVFPSFWSTPAH